MNLYVNISLFLTHCDVQSSWESVRTAPTAVFALFEQSMAPKPESNPNATPITITIFVHVKLPRTEMSLQVTQDKLNTYLISVIFFFGQASSKEHPSYVELRSSDTGLNSGTPDGVMCTPPRYRVPGPASWTRTDHQSWL